MKRLPGDISTEREAMLVSSILARDGWAFQELYEGYRPRLSRFLHHVMKRPSLVEDVFNETMLAVWEGLHRFKGESRLSTWVFAIAYNKSMKALARNDEPIDDDRCDAQASGAPDPEEQAAIVHREHALRRAIDNLSADHRAVMELTYFHEMGYDDIAVIMGCPINTVKTRMFHARRHLKRALSGDQSDWF